MGCLLSRPDEAEVAALRAQVAQLQAQCGGGGGGGRPGAYYMPPAVQQQGFVDALFFPDPAMPCRFGGQCRRHNCTYAHQQTNLTKLLSLLGGARSTIDVCVFTITCDELANALLDAHRRGVRVRVITDNDQSATTGSDIDRLRQAGVPTKMDADQYHMHHKFAIIDGRLLLNGSFNWTRQAVLFNQENLVIQESAQLVRAFATQFEALWRKYR